mgnify:FL=1
MQTMIPYLQSIHARAVLKRDFAPTRTTTPWRRQRSGVANGKQTSISRVKGLRLLMISGPSKQRNKALTLRLHKGGAGSYASSIPSARKQIALSPQTMSAPPLPLTEILNTKIPTAYPQQRRSFTLLHPSSTPTEPAYVSAQMGFHIRTSAFPRSSRSRIRHRLMSSTYWGMTSPSR